jgi:hypothetical protein
MRTIDRSTAFKRDYKREVMRRSSDHPGKSGTKTFTSLKKYPGCRSRRAGPKRLAGN